MKILIVGFGSIGKRHVKNLLNNTNNSIIICTKQKKNILEKIPYLKQHKSRIFTSNSLTSAIMMKPNIAIICNETSLHIDTSLKLAKQGIHLFIEKPLSNSLKNIDRLLMMIRKKRLITMMGCNFRFHPSFQTIKKIIDSNKIGTIYSIQIESNSYLPDWHTYEDYSKSYASRKKLGGGVSLTEIHAIDFIYWLFGTPNKIFSFTEKHSSLKIDTDDISTSLLHYGKKIAEVHLDFLQRPYYKRCKIIGEKGVILWDTDVNKIKIFDVKQKKWKIIHTKNNYRINSSRNNIMYIEELNYFLNCIKKNVQTFNTVIDGKKTLDIVLAMKKSSNLKKMVNLSN